MSTTAVPRARKNANNGSGLDMSMNIADPAPLAPRSHLRVGTQQPSPTSTTSSTGGNDPRGLTVGRRASSPGAQPHPMDIPLPADHSPIPRSNGSAGYSPAQSLNNSVGTTTQHYTHSQQSSGSSGGGGGSLQGSHIYALPQPPPGPQHSTSAPNIPQLQNMSGPQQPRAIRVPAASFLQQLASMEDPSAGAGMYYPTSQPGVQQTQNTPPTHAQLLQQVQAQSQQTWPLTPELFDHLSQQQIQVQAQPSLTAAANTLSLAQAQRAALAMQASLPNALAPGAGGLAYAGGAVSNKVSGSGSGGSNGSGPRAERSGSGSYDGGSPNAVNPYPSVNTGGSAGHSRRTSRDGISISPSHSTHSAQSTGSAPNLRSSPQSPPTAKGPVRTNTGGSAESPPAIYGPPLPQESVSGVPISPPAVGVFRSNTPSYRAVTPSGLRQSIVPESSDSDEGVHPATNTNTMSGGGGSGVRRDETGRILPFQEEEPEEPGDTSSGSARTLMHTHSHSSSVGSGGSGGGSGGGRNTWSGRGTGAGVGGGKEYYSPPITQTRAYAQKADYFGRPGSPTPSSDVLPDLQKQHSRQSSQSQVQIPQVQGKQHGAASYEHDLMHHGGRTSRADFRLEGAGGDGAGGEGSGEETLADPDGPSGISDSDDDWNHQHGMTNAQHREDMLTPRSPAIGLPAVSSVIQSPPLQSQQVAPKPGATSNPKSPRLSNAQAPGPSAQQQQQQQQVHAQQQAQRELSQSTIRARHRVSAGEQMGIRSFDPAMFEGTLDALQGGGQGQSPPQTAQGQGQQQQQQQAQARQRSYPPLDIPGSNRQGYPVNGQQQQQQQQGQVPLRSFFETPTPSSDGAFFEPLAGGYQGTGTGISTSSYTPSHGPGRPGAPIPPSAHSATNAPSPSPMLNATQPLPHYGVPNPYNMYTTMLGIPPTASPYPFPYDHVHRPAYGPPSVPPSALSAPTPAYDLHSQMLALQAQIADQRRAYALNSLHAAQTESTLSPAGTPFPPETGTGYEPWNYLRTSAVYAHPQDPRARGMAGMSSLSMRSSPSHEPVPLPGRPAPNRTTKKRGGANQPHQNGSAVRGPHPLRQAVAPARKPPPRVESTQPRETSPELESSGEETPREGDTGLESHLESVDQDRSRASTTQDGEAEEYATPADMSDADGPQRVWADNVHHPAAEEYDWAEDEDEEDDALELEFHPSYVGAGEKRRKRWDSKWDALVKAFQALDRETDATLVLLAAPNHAGAELHAMTSRSVRRDPSLLHAHSLDTIRREFAHVAAQRAASRSAHFTPLAQRLSSLQSSASVSGESEGPSSEREEELRRMLSSALSSLGALGGIYEAREARWREEVRRQNEDRESVEMLLRQSLGFGLLGNGTMGGVPTAQLL